MLSSKTHQQNLDMKDLYTKISEMKQIKTVIEEELIEVRTREDYYRNYYAEKEKEMAALVQKVEEDERTISEFNIARKSL
jgi:hypothetical protein